MSPRAAKPRAAGVRSDGEITNGNVSNPKSGQPNGNAPRSAVTGALARAGAGTSPEPYGEGSALAAAAAETPAPPGVSPGTHAAHQAMKNYHPAVTPLFAPTQRPLESVTAGAPMAPGPTDPMAQSIPGQSDMTIANILQEAAQASGSSALKALAAEAAATAGQAPVPTSPFQGNFLGR